MRGGRFGVAHGALPFGGGVDKKDVVGFLFQKGGLDKDDLGIVEIKESCAFAAVKQDKLSGLLDRIRDEKIKNMKAKFI